MTPVAQIIDRVVDHVVGTQSLHEVDLAGADHRGDDRALCLRELDGERADTAARTDDEHRLASDRAGLRQRLERCQS